MRDKYYKFDRVYNLVKDLKDKDEIRRRLDNELYKRPLTFANFRDYEYAYAYVYLLEDYEKARELIINIPDEDIKYCDCKLKNAYAVEAILGDSKMVREILEEAEQMALKDQDDVKLYGKVAIAWKELLDDNEGLSRCVRYSISRYRHKNDIRDILAIAKAYKHLEDTSAMCYGNTSKYYMDYACAVAESAADKTYIADCWSQSFNDYEKCILWLTKAVEQLGADYQYMDIDDIIYQLEVKATTTMDWLECLALWDSWQVFNNRWYCLIEAIEAITHPQHYLCILDYSSYEELSEYRIDVLEKMETFLENATHNNIPQEHLGFLWLDCAELYKSFGKVEKYEECIAKSDVAPGHRTENELEDFKDIEPSQRKEK